MGVLNKGTDFSNGDQVTDTNLDNLVDNATFTSSAVDGVSTAVGGTGAIIIKDGGITTGKLADSTGASDGVTAAKIATGAVTTAKLAASAVTSAKIDSGAVTSAKIAASAVTSEKIGAGEVEFSNLAASVLAAIYPVGSIYMNASDSTNPSTLLGFGTWVAFGAGRVPVGIDSSDTDFDTAEETGGAKTHTLDLDEMPSHRHGGIQPSGSTGGNSNGFDVDSPVNGGDVDTYQKFTKYAGGAGSDSNGTLTSAGDTQAHNNLQPYIVVHMWKRTA